MLAYGRLLEQRQRLGSMREICSELVSAVTDPAIALTAQVQKDDAEQALAAGSQRHAPQPVDPHRLTILIATVKTPADE